MTDVLPDRPAEGAVAPVPPVEPVPSDAILLHIGVHKTGTTALQR